ncbi:Dor1-domain-containing protein [Rickenella mellea]|uniref:Conserved oligomeric Golgi complex subunit 8 n=1 Tax=Rickenella mellea TaxID=50990 RepID=A0A4Y7Q023_9AGAM|nr:Dor1-domain-containing protein [Rickenella mellea]
MERAGRNDLADILASQQADNDAKAKFSSPDITGYLSHITTLPLADILREPTNLSSEAAQLSNSLVGLCHSEYPTFLSLHHTSSVLSSTLSSFSESLSSLLGALPDLESKAREFTAVTKDIQAERQKANLLIEQHDKLVDILEIPQLIDTCVRNGYYQEAMDLSAHARSLAVRFPDIDVVRGIEAEVDQAMRIMLAQLLSLLREPVKLPALFKATNFLRKMEVLDEPELAVAFLTSRLVNLNSTLGGIENERSVDPARSVRRYVDAWREGVYDVVTQYTTIFLDRTNEHELEADLRALLATFAHHMLSSLRSLLSTNLPLVDDPTALASLLTHLTYCATSFARVGLDFRSVLPPLFDVAVTANFERTVGAATNAFTTAVSDAQRYNRSTSVWLVTAAAAASPPEDNNVTPSQPVHMAPNILASYPPLAIFTNGILTALNNLRLLAPLSLLHPLLASLDTSLATCATSFLVYAQLPPTSATSTVLSARISGEQEQVDERKVIQGARKVLVNVLVPFVRRALVEGVYGVKEELGMGKELESGLKAWREWLETQESVKADS